MAHKKKKEGGKNASFHKKQIIPILNKAIHHLGVHYFDLCWNTDDYSKDYTSEELYDLEQTVLDTLKNLQDIAISLVQRKRLYGTDS